MRDSDHILMGIQRKIKQHGWAVMGVLGDERTPAFGYAVGLWQTFKHAEILIVGLDPALMQRLINSLGQCVRAGETFAAGQTDGQVIEGYRAAFRAVPVPAYRPWLNIARRLYRGTAFPALQCVWPDTQGRFPWEAGFEERFRAAQPLVGLTEAS